MADWNPQANSLFLDARELPAGLQREEYLCHACGADTALRAEVDALLTAEARADSFLESGAPDLPPDGSACDSTSMERPGDKVGPFILQQEIGEGGMGLVFMAEQTEPVRRQVALKIIKPGMDTRQVIARFEAEQQALALMDHPNIAKVLDAGTTEAGRPYFVMELVKGLPITTYCDDQKLGLRERLSLFILVCHAVQHAHQKGVIHRDLKPSNIMVALYDGQPAPKVIDFGVAKAIGQKLTERTMFTEFGAVLGTLEYMSPEQAELNQLDVDTRSDVYSLGVLLFELMTGSTPLESDRARSASFDDVRRVIREEDPPRPSTRISGSAKLPALAAQRQLEPRQLMDRVRGELDWIILKALEKDRSRRYQTANDLARDIERHLADEVVEARPSSLAYRLAKFARRNRGPVATAGLLAASILLGAGACVWLAIRATRAERAAELNSALADEAAKAERTARADETRLRQQAESLSVYLVNLLNEMIPEVGHSREAPSLIQSAERVKESFSDNPDIRASLARALARAYLNMRRFDAAAVELRQCLELTRDPRMVFETQFELAHCLLRAGDVDEGTRMLRELLQKKLGRVFGADADELRTLIAGFPRIDVHQREVPGQEGLALDGDADYVIIPDLQFDGQPPWTLEAIVRADDIDQYQDHNGAHWTSLVSASDGGSIGLETNGGKWAIDLYTADSRDLAWTANYSTAFAANPVQLSQWQHLAGVWDGTELRLYVDGNLEGTQTGVNYCTELSEGPFFIGADPADWNLEDLAQGYLHGCVRSVRISHGVEYTASFSPPESLTTTPKTLLLYDFTIDTGRYAIDRSGHDRHGIIVGAKFVSAGEQP